MRSKLGKAFVSVTAFLFLVAVGVGIAAFAMSGGENKASTESVSFNGSWSANVNDQKFVAIITGDTIEINWNTDPDTSALYWKGTFPAPAKAGDSMVVTSRGDTDAMSNSMLGSQDAVKVFTYQHGSLDFQFRVMGVTQTIHLAKQDPGV